MKFFILIILFSINIFAKDYGTFTCKEIQYGYINGIFNKREMDAKDAADKIRKNLNIKEEVKTFYNKSFGRYDLVRAVFQKLEESNKKFLYSSKKAFIVLFIRGLIGEKYYSANQMDDQELLKTVTTDNQKEIETKILKSYDENKELIIFSHSQGNFYANKACEDLGKWTFKNIQIATPTSEIKCGEPQHYTSIHSDEMIGIVSRVGKPLADTLGLNIKSPLKTNASQLNGKYVEKNTNIFPVDTITDLYNVYKFFQSTSNQSFEVHSIDNYLTNPPSLSKIKSHHSDLVHNNFSTQNKNIIENKDVSISCENIASFLDTKIEIHRGPASVVGQNINVKDKLNISIEEKNGTYKVSDYSLDDWFNKKFWWLYILAAPFALMIAGSVASSVKKSEEYTNRGKQR